MRRLLLVVPLLLSTFLTSCAALSTVVSVSPPRTGPPEVPTASDYELASQNENLSPQGVADNEVELARDRAIQKVGSYESWIDWLCLHLPGATSRGVPGCES